MKKLFVIVKMLLMVLKDLFMFNVNVQKGRHAYGKTNNNGSTKNFSKAYKQKLNIAEFYFAQINNMTKKASINTYCKQHKSLKNRLIKDIETGSMESEFVKIDYELNSNGYFNINKCLITNPYVSRNRFENDVQDLFDNLVEIVMTKNNMEIPCTTNV